MMRKTILYIMHIPWGWIKQRPHFIAENLAHNNFDVDIKYRKSNRLTKKDFVKNNKVSPTLNIKGYRIISFQKIPLLKIFETDWINKIIFRISVNNNYKYDYIWITSPLIYNYLCKVTKKNKLVYDCMDDFLEFPEVKEDITTYNKFYFLEKKILLESDIVFCSSEHLASVLKNRYNIDREIIIVNNAINLYNNVKSNNTDSQLVVDFIKELENPFIYIGTISSWFDFNTIISFLNTNKNSNVVLIGPKGNTSIPLHDRLHFLGPIEHDQIFEVMSCAKALIMPFILNDLILSVNPVKLYEYIYSGKPIIARRYAETLKFEKFISLYEDEREFVEIADKIINGSIKKESAILMKEFAKKNTWEERCKQIIKYL
jgi:hypothetical protein